MAGSEVCEIDVHALQLIESLLDIREDSISHAHLFLLLEQGTIFLGLYDLLRNGLLGNHQFSSHLQPPEFLSQSFADLPQLLSQAGIFSGAAPGIGEYFIGEFKQDDLRAVDETEEAPPLLAFPKVRVHLFQEEVEGTLACLRFPLVLAPPGEQYLDQPVYEPTVGATYTHKYELSSP